MDAIKTAQAEMNAIVAERRVRNELILKVPIALDWLYEVAEEMPAYSVDDNEIVGPLRF